MYTFSKDMTLAQFQENFLQDKEYVQFCKKIYTKLGEPKYKATNGIQKNTMCFVMALFLNGVSNGAGSCGNKFVSDVAGFSQVSSWMRQAGGFYRIGKNGELDITADDHAKIRKYPRENTLQQALNWFFEESKIVIQKTKKVDGATTSLKDDLKVAANNMMNVLVLNISFSNIKYMEKLDMVELLRNNKQLILNGSPGTGKTFSARNEIANGLFGFSGELTAEQKKEKEIRMQMVQFHPSYDYTDFMEGIRPVLNSGAISYTLKNGVFKEFCCKAGVLERIDRAGEERNRDTLAKFLHIVTKEGEATPKVGENALLDFWEAHMNEEEAPAFLFIIDEINRAEISKVLGEIMYCLDPDYRGREGEINTQYSSLATQESFYVFEENDVFFIPSNVYIIGTMNDIDRSVEVFDFALRRRFAWHEVEADEVMDKVLESMKVKEILGEHFASYMKRIHYINDCIEDELKLTRQYHLGPSYFAKIILYYNNDFSSALKSVWQNHILQILIEYVKNKKNYESKVLEIGEIFCSEAGPVY